MAVRILVNDDEVAIVQALKTLLNREGYEVVTTRSSEEALELLKEQQFNLLVSDIFMKPMDGIELLKQATELHPHMAVILITGYSSVEKAIDAMNHGAFDFICKPFRITDLVVTVQRALTYESTMTENVSQLSSMRVREHIGGLVGESKAMHKVYQMVENLARDSETILIQGEMGTEKDKIARAIHQKSKRYTGPFVRIGCSELEEAALSQQLFGTSTDGSASETNLSFFFQAKHGTAYIDDIHAMPRSLQARLPHFLRKLDAQNSADSNQGALFDVRLVVSSRGSLKDLVAEDLFDPELLHELIPYTIHVPPLRDRIEDLPLLVRQALDQHPDVSKRALSVAPAVYAAFESHRWPGNVNELTEVVGKAADACSGKVITMADLPEPHRTELASGGDGKASGSALEYRWRSLKAFLKANEREYIQYVVAESNDERDRASSLLGLTNEEFEEKVKSFG